MTINPYQPPQGPGERSRSRQTWLPTLIILAIIAGLIGYAIFQASQRARRKLSTDDYGRAQTQPLPVGSFRSPSVSERKTRK